MLRKISSKYLSLWGATAKSYPRYSVFVNEKAKQAFDDKIKEKYMGHEQLKEKTEQKLFEGMKEAVEKSIDELEEECKSNLKS